MAEAVGPSRLYSICAPTLSRVIEQATQQVAAQVPPVHALPAGQVTPHAPQFALSVAVLVQTPLQLVSPVWQLS